MDDAINPVHFAFGNPAADPPTPPAISPHELKASDGLVGFFCCADPAVNTAAVWSRRDAPNTTALQASSYAFQAFMLLTVDAVRLPILMIAASKVNERGEQIVCIACGCDDANLDTIEVDGIVTSMLVNHMLTALRITWNNNTIVSFAEETVPASVRDLNWDP